MSKTRVVPVPILPFDMVNAFVVIGEGGAILVDAGIPGSEAKVERVLANEGLSFRDLKLIVITHSHVDHAGAAARIRELSGAPIVAHRGDLVHYEREVPMTYRPTGLVGRMFFKTPVPHEPYTAFTPDIMLDGDESLALAPYGIDGRIERTAGHTAGSISVTLANGSALVGDLLASGILIGGMARLDHATRPPFEDDPHAVGHALERLLDEGMERFYLGHGGPLPAAEVRRHAAALLSLAA